MGLTINWQQISIVCWACWGVNSWGTDLQLLYDFPSDLIWRWMVSFHVQSFFDSLRVLFCGFIPNSAYTSILKNLDLLERGKSLVFFFPSVETLESSLCHTLTNSTFSFHFTYSSSRGSNFILLFYVVLYKDSISNFVSSILWLCINNWRLTYARNIGLVHAIIAMTSCK